ncbi:MAG: HD-GYP domain-containing protein, partial [Gemmatimonadales bacterium]
MSTDAKVRVYVAVVVLITITAGVSAYYTASSVLSPLPIVGFTALAVFLEQGSTRLSLSAMGSVVFVIHISATILFGPIEGAIIAAASTAASEALFKRAPIKAVFNTAQKTLAVLGSGQVYLLLGGALPFNPHDANWLAFAGLSVLYFAINSVLVNVAIAISTGRNVGDVWSQNSRGSLGYDLLASGFAIMVAWFYQSFGVVGLVGILIPVVVVRAVYGMYHRLQAQSREMLELMVKAIEARDPYTSGHSVRVATLSRTIAQELRLPYDLVEKIHTAALLHDVGKIHEEFAPLLRKSESLTDEEERLMQTHPALSAELVGVISALRGIVVDSVRSHHERWDGRGYPEQRSGERIPLGARIITIADTVDAMT